MKLKLDNRVYDVLKWACLLGLPSISMLYSALCGIWGWPYAREVSMTINAVIACIGAMIRLSTASYNEEAEK